MDSSIAISHDTQCTGDRCSQRQNSLLHADEALLAQRASYLRVFQPAILREAVLGNAARVNVAKANIADALACRSVGPANLTQLPSASHDN